MYGFRNTKFFDGGIAIGGTCKDPVLAAKVLDYGYSEDGYMMFNFGKEGISYTMEDGKPVYTDIIKNNEDGWPVGQAMAKYIMACYNGPFVQSGDYQLQYFNIDEQEMPCIHGTTADLMRQLFPPSLLPKKKVWNMQRLSTK